MRPEPKGPRLTHSYTHIGPTDQVSVLSSQYPPPSHQLPDTDTLPPALAKSKLQATGYMDRLPASKKLNHRHFHAQEQPGPAMAELSSITGCRAHTSRFEIQA